MPRVHKMVTGFDAQSIVPLVRLVTRLTLAFLLVVMLMISLHEYWQLGDRQADFERDMDRTHLLVATTLAESVELIVQREGIEVARMAVVQADQRRHGDLRIRWVCMPDGGDAPTAPVSCELLGDDPQTVTRDAGDEGRRRFTLVPIDLDGKPLGAIEVSELPSHEGDWVRQHFNNAVLLALMTVGGMAFAAFVLGLWLVARPARLLREKARAVGRGELQEDLVLNTKDELSEIADEMNAMCRQLFAAQSEAAREASARLTAVEQLRHADRLATVGRLATGLAHELGTPLNVIEARAELIVEDTDAAPQVQNSAKIIINCAEQVTKLVRQLLDFARPRTPELMPVPLPRLAGTTADLLQPLAAKRNVSIEIDVLKTVSALGDEVLLQQALTNVVVNAIHASSAGSTVRITTDSVNAIKPGASGPQPWSVLRVTDSGTGMSDEVQASVFEPFFTTKAVGEGTGLGLPITVSIIEDHRGFMTFESEPGRGSTFSIHLQPASAAS